MLFRSQNALNSLKEEIRGWDSLLEQSKEDGGQFWQKFEESVNNDLNTPQAVAVLWQMVHSDTPTSSKSRLILDMDKILGLGLETYLGKPLEIPQDVKRLIEEREAIRKSGDFRQSDVLRTKIKKMGYEVKDTPSGPKAKRVLN